MPIQEFVLDGVGTRRAQVFRGTNLVEEPLTVLLDRSIIGTISQEEFITGREFPLKDGSVLKVQVVNNQVQVLRNGLALPSVTANQELTRGQPAPTSNPAKGCSGSAFISLIITLTVTHTIISTTAWPWWAFVLAFLAYLVMTLIFFVIWWSFTRFQRHSPSPQR